MTPTADAPDASSADTSPLPEASRGNVQIVPHSVRAIRPHDIAGLFGEEGWWPARTPSIIATMLDGSVAVGAWRNDQLIGFARAVSDGVARAYVEDVVVTQAERRAAVGGQLIEALLAQLAHIPVVSLFCTASLVSFYELHGFHRTRQVVMHRESADSGA
jgi:GNAT superfamily N-acetyltransferase